MPGTSPVPVSFRCWRWMHPHPLFISVHRKLSFSCQRRVKDCFRHPARSTDNCWVVSTKVQNALPLSQCCHGSRGDQLRREMAGSVTVYVERFQVHVARDLAGKPRMGMGRHHGVCGPLKFYYCFSPLMAETRASLPPEMTPFNSALETVLRSGCSWTYSKMGLPRAPALDPDTTLSVSMGRQRSS